MFAAFSTLFSLRTDGPVFRREFSGRLLPAEENVDTGLGGNVSFQDFEPGGERYRGDPFQPLRRGASGARAILSFGGVVTDPPDDDHGISKGVASPSLKVSCTPVMNCFILPAWKRLDQEPREEVDEDKEGADGGKTGEGENRDQVGETGLARSSRPRERLK